MNVYEISFRQTGFATTLDFYRPVAETLELAMSAARVRAQKDYKDMELEVVSAKEIARDVIMPNKRALRTAA